MLLSKCFRAKRQLVVLTGMYVMYAEELKTNYTPLEGESVCERVRMRAKRARKTKIEREAEGES